jgi:hypothetical protein
VVVPICSTEPRHWDQEPWANETTINVILKNKANRITRVKKRFKKCEVKEELHLLVSEKTSKSIWVISMYHESLDI